MEKKFKSRFVKSVLPLLAAFPVGGNLYSQAAEKLNFIVILADDMGWKDPGYEGSGIETPNLDRMADEGMRFTHFYAMGAMSSPSRAALLTGRYQHSVGVPELCSPSARNGVPPLHLDLNAVTIPEALKEHGYKTMISGKWHLGNDPEYWPRKHGFDRFWGSLIGTPGYYNPQQTYDNETAVKVEGYFTDEITSNALKFIDEHGSDPFFLYIAYNAPHYPLEAPEELISKYRKKFEYDKYAVYAAMIDRMDQGIGRVFDKLRELHLDGNTFVFFTTDNGPSPESVSGRGYGLRGAKISAGPLREHKFSTFEGGIRVPAVAWWPGHIKAGSVTQSVACNMDIFPTIMDILDSDPGTVLHGSSMLPVLSGKDKEIHDVLHWEDALMWAVQMGKWKLVGRFWEPEPHLFDLDSDLSEQNDLAGKYPAVVKKMNDMHRQWQKENYPDPFRRDVKKRPEYQFPRE